LWKNVSDQTKQSISNIINEIVIEKPKNNLNAARNILCKSSETNKTIEKNVDNKS
jgi:hypothetical protein